MIVAALNSGGLLFPLMAVKPAEMDRITKKDDPDRTDITGYPLYYCDDGRVWPMPSPDVRVVTFAEFGPLTPEVKP